MRGTALGLAHTIGSKSVELVDVAIEPDANALVLTDDAATFTAELRTPDASAGSPVVFRISFEDAKRLLKDPELARRRYAGLSS
jgi:hypothetical protein